MKLLLMTILGLMFIFIFEFETDSLLASLSLFFSLSFSFSFSILNKFIFSLLLFELYWLVNDEDPTLLLAVPLLETQHFSSFDSYPFINNYFFSHDKTLLKYL